MRLACLFACLTALATPSFAQGVEGSYALRGTNPDGSSYVGSVEISAISEVTCEIVWSTGGQESVGICMRYHNAFAAAYTLNEDIGLLIYEIRPDGSMEGTWTVAGQDGVGTEILIPQ